MSLGSLVGTVGGGVLAHALGLPPTFAIAAGLATLANAAFFVATRHEAAGGGDSPPSSIEAAARASIVKLLGGGDSPERAPLLDNEATEE